MRTNDGLDGAPTPTVAKIAHIKQTLLAQLDLEVAQDDAAPSAICVSATADDRSVSSWSLASSGSPAPVIAHCLAPRGTGDVIRTAASMGDLATLRSLSSRWRDDVAFLELDEYGRTVCFMAAFYGQTEALALLIEAGCDFNSPNDGGYSPLFVALCRNHAQSVNLLRIHGAELFPAWLRCLPCAESVLSNQFLCCFVCSAPLALSTVAHLLCRKLCCRRGTHTRLQQALVSPPPSPPLPPLPPLLPLPLSVPPPPPGPEASPACSAAARP